MVPDTNQTSEEAQLVHKLIRALSDKERAVLRVWILAKFDVGGKVRDMHKLSDQPER